MTTTTKPPTAYQILHAVEQATGATAEEIKSDCKFPRITHPRFLAMLIYAETHPWSGNREAAEAVGRNHASTGLYALRRARFLFENDAAFRLAHKRAMEILNQ
jgi:chromosomal replication initiation ATPase DnaA